MGINIASLNTDRVEYLLLIYNVSKKMNDHVNFILHTIISIASFTFFAIDSVVSFGGYFHCNPLVCADEGVTWILVFLISDWGSIIY